MTNARKNLKFLSVAVVVFAIISCAKGLIDIFWTFTNLKELPEGVTETVAMVTAIILAVISVVLLLPRLYVGIKGIKVANHPDSSKGHIVWAVILTVIAVLALIDPVSNLIKNFNLTSNILDVINLALDVLIYGLYAKYAMQVSKAA